MKSYHSTPTRSGVLAALTPNKPPSAAPGLGFILRRVAMPPSPIAVSPASPANHTDVPPKACVSPECQVSRILLFEWDGSWGWGMGIYRWYHL